MSFDFDYAVQAPFRMQPGLRRMAPGSRHLNASSLRGAYLATKLAVLRDTPASALCCVEGFDPTPALQALAHQAAIEAPEAFAAADDGTWSARQLGWAVRRDGTVSALPRSPAEGNSIVQTVGEVLGKLPAVQRQPALLCLAFEQDFAIVDAATATIPWTGVCLPSHWAPADKVGRHFAQVHAPVADNALLLKAGAHLMRLVSGEERWERFVWTIAAHARLDAHPARLPRDARWADAATRATAGLSDAWWRTEHQTFLPVPERGQAVFTIHVEVNPLADVARDPARAACIADALGSMSEAVLDYRGLRDVRDPLLAALTKAAQRTA